MTTDRLTELKELVTNGLHFDDHTQVFTAYRAIPDDVRRDLLELIEEKQSRQSVGNNESICAVCLHHAPFNITEPCENECRGNSCFLAKTELSRQSVADEEVQSVITTLEEYAYQNLDEGFEPCQISTGEVIDVVLPILSAYRKPSADQAEIDRAIAIFQEHIDEAEKIVGHKPDCKYCEASTLAITALRRMAGEGK